MEKKELILKAVEYVNDIPARVEDFLTKEKFKEGWDKDTQIFSKYYCGIDPYGEKPMFKKGDWVIRNKSDSDPRATLHQKGRIFRINKVRGDCIDEGTGVNTITHDAYALRLLTKDEIQKYLIDNALRRGFVGYRKFRWSDGLILTILPNRMFEYVSDCDALIVSIMENETQQAIYMEGEWAEPLFENIDYQVALEHANKVPLFYIGQEVKTPIGIGIIVMLQIPYNGLHIMTDKATAVVWFGVETAKGGFSSKSFNLSEIDHTDKYTCSKCSDVKTCPLAFDGYNTNGDCLAIK